MVKSLRDNVLLVEFLIGDEIGQSLGGSQFHLLVDVAGADVKGAAEHAGEGQDVVDLVGIVATAGGDDPGAARLGVIGEDLGGGVSAGEDDGILVHGLDHLGGDGAGSGHADEHVGAHQHVGQGAGLLLQVGDLGHLLLDPVQALPALIDDALPVAHGHILEPGGQQQLDDGDGGGAGTGGDHLHVLLLLAHHFEGVGQAGQGDDSGAVLVIVEDGDVALLLQLLLDLKAPGSGDVLQVDAAEGAGYQVHGVDELVHVLGLDAQREGVHAAEGLEQHALALHDWHTGLGADVAQTQNGGAVGDDGAQVVPAGQLIALVDVLLDLKAGLGHAGGVGQGQVVLGGNGDGGHHLDFALPFAVQTEGFFCVIQLYSSLVLKNI